MLFKIVVIIFITQFIYNWCIIFQEENGCDEANEETFNVEFYQKDDSLFILISERVAWFEAASICTYFEAILSIPNSTAKANYIAHFLAESNFRFEDYWLGAKYIEEKQEWIWLNGFSVNTSNISIPGPWRKNINGKNCLVIERSKHYTPMFAAMSCYLPKPLICERSATAETTKPLPSLPIKTIRIKDSIYTFYHSKISWNKALAFCRSIGQRLAVIMNKEVMKVLRTEMLRARPRVENVWIGGKYHENSWIWVPTGIKIPIKKQDNDYPPWLNDDTGNITDGCLLFDRHFVYSFFVPERCERERDFICEQYVHTPKPVHFDNNSIICIYKTVVMSIYLFDKTWAEANAFCIANDNILVEPKDFETVKAIAICLGDHPAEPKHVWLGGTHKEDFWRWEHSKSAIENSLPWCEKEHDQNSPCLNLDRTDHDEPHVYGLQCRKRQPFVCADKNSN